MYNNYISGLINDTSGTEATKSFDEAFRDVTGNGFGINLVRAEANLADGMTKVDELTFMNTRKHAQVDT